jgi:hypothetical protein
MCAQAMHKMDDMAAAARELRVTVALLKCLLVCEPTLALELPKLELGHGDVDVLSLLTRVLDAAAALAQPDLDLLGAYAASMCRASAVVAQPFRTANSHVAMPASPLNITVPIRVASPEFMDPPSYLAVASCLPVLYTHVPST